MTRGNTLMRGLLTVAVVALSSAAGSAWGQAQYTVTDLGTLPGCYVSYANGINDSGQVVGYGYGQSIGNTAFLYSGGVMTDMNDLVPPGSGWIMEQAQAINASGQVVGVVQSGSLGTFGLSFDLYLYGNGAMTVLGYGSVNAAANATGINAVGQIVGTEGTGTAFTNSGGVNTYLGTLGGRYSWATGVNANGQVVGYTEDPPFGRFYPISAFIYSNGVMTGLPSQGTRTEATAINDSGQVVGFGNSTGNYHAFLYSGGGTVNLGLLSGYSDSYATAINASGQVVGWADPSPSLYPSLSSSHAFLYSDGTIADLNSLIPSGSNWTLVDASGINDIGQIVGWGISPSGEQHAFLLTPTPEPSTLALLGAGAVGLLAYAWRRRKRAL